MIITVTQSPGESLEDAIQGAILVSARTEQHVEFVCDAAPRLIVTYDDTVEAVLGRIAQHPKGA